MSRQDPPAAKGGKPAHRQFRPHFGYVRRWLRATEQNRQAQSTMTPTTQAKIHIERMMYRASIAVPGESAASYALVKLIPTGSGAASAMGLNLALVLDV